MSSDVDTGRMDILINILSLLAKSPSYKDKIIMSFGFEFFLSLFKECNSEILQKSVLKLIKCLLDTGKYFFFQKVTYQNHILIKYCPRKRQGDF